MAFSTKEKIDNLSKIEQIATQRGVEYLVHFTPLIFLPQILNEGLFSRTKLRTEKPGRFIPVDKYRYDKKPSRISLSITFPNNKMFYIKRRDSINLIDKDKWAILALDSKILWELDCQFFPINAATGSSIKTSDSYSSEFFYLMFSNTNSIPSHLTADVQAEVMVKDYIPPEYIKSIIVENAQAKKICMETCKTSIEIIINKQFFGYRENFIANL